MRSSGACWLSLLLVLVASAPGAEPGEPAQLGLEELMRRMATTDGVEAHFRETRELSLLSAPLESRGRLYFIPPDRLARFTTWPAFSAVVADGKSVLFRESEDAAPIDLSGSPTARVLMDHFVALFGGDLERLRRIYSTGFSVDGRSWTLVLTPRGAPLDRFVERIVLQGDDRGLAEILLVDGEGDRTTTRFEEVDRERSFTPAEIERLFSKGLPLSSKPGP